MVAGPNGFAGTRVSFEHSLVCDNGILIANYAKAYGLTTLFVPVTGNDISSLLAANPTTIKNYSAMTAAASVYLVAGDPSWLNSPQTVPADVVSLAKIAKLFPKTAGILYAVDPEASASWNSASRQDVISSYFSLVQTLLGAPGAVNFRQTYFLAHADFATQKDAAASSSPTMLAQLQSYAAVSGLMLLAPGSSSSQQLSNIGAALPALTKPFWLESSASKYSANSYYGVSPAVLQSNMSQLQQAVSGQNQNLTGIEVNGWNDLYNGLHSILPQPPVYNGTLAGGRLVPPAGSIYLGAFVNPTGKGASMSGTAAFEKNIGRKLAYNMHFYGWKNTFPGAGEADDVAHGRLPVIAWNCGNSDANVTAGKEDALIAARAKAIAAFGHPVMMRWFWEMNLDDTNNAPRWQCYDPSTDLPNGYFSPMRYIAAWKHIRSVFAANGATNVIWLWCVANAHGGPAQYYPGDDQVDWAGMDDYDNNDVSLSSTIYILSNELSQFQEKPFMITETGAHAVAQPAFFNGAAATLKTQFPWVRAIGYLDSKGSFQDWVLSAAGLADFKAFANDPYMSAVPGAL